MVIGWGKWNEWKMNKLPSGMSPVDVYYMDITYVIFIHGNT